MLILKNYFCYLRTSGFNCKWIESLPQTLKDLRYFKLWILLNLNFKYQRFTLLRYKNIRNTKFKSQFLFLSKKGNIISESYSWMTFYLLFLVKLGGWGRNNGHGCDKACWGNLDCSQFFQFYNVLLGIQQVPKPCYQVTGIIKILRFLKGLKV